MHLQWIEGELLKLHFGVAIITWVVKSWVLGSWSHLLEVVSIIFLPLLRLLVFFFLFYMLWLLSPLRSTLEWLKLHSRSTKWMKAELHISISKCLPSLSLLSHARSHACSHLLHHCIKRAASTSASTIPKSWTKRLRKDVAQVLIAKSLFEDLIDVDIIKALCTFAKLIITSSFCGVAQCSISFSNMLKGVHRTWCFVLIRMYFQCKL